MTTCCAPARDATEASPLLADEPVDVPAGDFTGRLGPEDKLWKCACGKHQFKLTGAPHAVFNCHCKSCASAAKFVAAKNDPPCTASALTAEGGVMKALYYLENVEKLTPEVPDYGYVKIGQDGGNIRVYTKCCNTPMQTAGGDGFPMGVRPFNRNCVYNKDGSKFEPEDVPNVMAGEAFDADKVPEPKYTMLPCGLLCCAMIPAICAKNCCGPCCGTGEGTHTGVPFFATGDIAEVTEQADWSTDAPGIAKQ